MTRSEDPLSSAPVGYQERIIRCGAWIEKPDYRWVCTLPLGHPYDMDDPKTWHTDCPEGVTDAAAVHDHGGAQCLAWADHAHDAHPSPNAVSGDSVMRAARDETVSAGPVFPKITGDYEAHVVIGGASLRARGPHRVISNLLRAFADAFEEEIER